MADAVVRFELAREVAEKTRFLVERCRLRTVHPDPPSSSELGIAVAEAETQAAQGKPVYEQVRGS